MITEAFYHEIRDLLWKSAQYEKRASHDPSDQHLATKASHDVHVWDRVVGVLKEKTANAGALAKHPAARGLMAGVGAAVPLGLVGGHLVSKAGDESRKTVADIRNKALQAAAGIAAIGGGLYAMHRNQSSNERTASVTPTAEELVEKLATVGYLDTVFTAQALSTDPAAHEKAATCRALNAEYGVTLLQELLR